MKDKSGTLNGHATLAVASAMSNLNNCGTTTNINNWGYPERLEVNEYPDHIEMVFKETSMITYTVYPPRPPETRIFKIVFSVIDGKWNKSERIYGKIIPKTKETYEFDE